MSNPTLSPNWPVNYPFRGTKAFTSSQPGTVTLAVGDIGRVAQYANSKKLVYVIVENKPGKPKGWVPQNCVEVGRVREYAKNCHRVRERTRVRSVPEGTVGMFTSYNSHAGGALEGCIPNWLKQLNSPQKITNYLQPIWNGVQQAGLVDVFNKPEFKLQDIVQKARLVNQSNHNGGIYMLVFADFNDEPDRLPEVYVGKTYDFGARHRQHRNSNDSRQAVHRAWRLCNTQDMYVLCRIDGQSPDIEDRRTAAEQIFTCLLETYDPVILDNTKLLPDVSVEDVLAEPAASSGAAVAQKLFHWKRQAILLQTYERSTRNLSGWKGGVSRPGFGVGKGLNWSSPFGELWALSDKVLWLKSTYPDMEVYRRSPLKARKGRSSITCAVIQKHHYAHGKKIDHTDALEISFPASATEPPPDTMTQTVVEIVPSGQSHPVPYARLTSIGPWPDWDEAKRVGIKVEWTSEDGTFQQKYLQSSGSDRNLHATKEAGQLHGHSKATGVIRYFNLVVFNDVQKWPDSFGTADVKHVVYDHLEQSIRIRDNAQQTTSTARPQMLSVQQMGQRLQALANVSGVGPTKVGGAFGVFPSGGTPRRTCDGCHLQGLQPHRCKVKEDGQTNCEYCVRLGLPCTWTINNDLRRKPRLISALVPPARDNRAVAAVEMDDPQLVYTDA